ncbi:MAG TPA: GAF domain-containing protein [Aggregatilineaceae bacterium]|nr:GAF domain-containing protein [Aggregatilineaceae bacterium]
MIQFLRYLFVVQYDYRDSTQATRARILLPLSSVIAILALIFGFYLITATLLGIDSQANALLGPVTAPLMILWTTGALWLTQRGKVQLAALMIAVLLAAVSTITISTNGMAPSALLTLPIVLTYMGLAYRAKGATITTLAVWIMLPVVAYLQSEGKLAADEKPFDDLIYEALVSAQMLTLTAILLWVFAWNLQSALVRINRIASQTRTIADIGQVISRILNMDELLTHSVDLIRDRFALYHVQIFIVDENRSYANLTASTGTIGQALLAQGYRVPLGSRTLVGEAISKGNACYEADLERTSYRRPELLINTRTELALPLQAGDDVIGVLDIQSLRPNAFSNEDIETLRVVANQLSQAIQNARMFETQQRGLLQNRRLFLESETNLREIERLNRQLTGQSWQQYISERGTDQFGIQIVGQEVQTGPINLTTVMQQAIQRQRLVASEENGEQVLAVPIQIRGQAIGVIEVRRPNDQSQSDIRNILQAVVERLAFSLENARLFEQARMSAEREQQINQISTRLQGLTSVEDVLTTALQSLGEALSAEQGSIRLIPLDVSVSGNGHKEQTP